MYVLSDNTQMFMAKKNNVGTFAAGRDIVGKKAVFEFKHRPQGTVQVEVRIKDFKTSWGQERYLIEPIAGRGSIWVEKLQFA